MFLIYLYQGEITSNFDNLSLSQFIEETGLVGFMVFNTTFYNISAISWQSVLLERTTGQPQITDKLYHIMLYSSP